MPRKFATTVNHWTDSACARVFWGQQELPPYRQLLADTSAWLQPRSGERWLDLGCGCGKLTEALWRKSQGKIREIIGLDCAADNAQAFAQLRGRVRPAAGEESIRFLHADFSSGLARWDKGRFDGIVSGLAIQYAESFSEKLQRWTTDAYDRLLADVHRLLRGGGWFVFSVNTPNPSWCKVALYSLWGAFNARRVVRYADNAFRMWRYGCWLKRQARGGRFHYLPLATVCRKLMEQGFTAVEHRLSFAGQAYLIRCRRAAEKITVPVRSRPMMRPALAEPSPLPRTSSWEPALGLATTAS
jgi:SAM-dependent methyltransferase